MLIFKFLALLVRHTNCTAVKVLSLFGNCQVALYVLVTVDKELHKCYRGSACLIDVRASNSFTLTVGKYVRDFLGIRLDCFYLPCPELLRFQVDYFMSGYELRICPHGIMEGIPILVSPISPFSANREPVISSHK